MVCSLSQLILDNVWKVSCKLNVYGSVHRKYIPIYIKQDTTLHSLFISGNYVTLHLVICILEYKLRVVFFCGTRCCFHVILQTASSFSGQIPSTYILWLITTAACIIFLYSNVLSFVDILYSLVYDKTRSCSSANVIVRPVFGDVSVLGRVHFRWARFQIRWALIPWTYPARQKRVGGEK